MPNRIWTVSTDRDKAPLACFSTKEGAERYIQTLIERYSLGQRLALHGRQLAPDIGAWKFGFGPEILEQPVDEHVDGLPGAWLVKVDDSCRMVACAFTTAYRPARSPVRYKQGINTICEAYGATPHAALDRARRAMMAYLSGKHSWR